MSRGTYLLPLLLAALALTACPGPEWPKCENDDHCKSDREGNEGGQDLICVFGQCQQCAKDVDCKDGKVCRTNRCVPKPECERDADCSGNQICGANKCKLECQGDSDCGMGKGCVDNRCQAKADCAEDADCPEGQSCESGSCSGNSGDAMGAGGDCSIEPRVFFDFNKSSITSSARALLDQNAECMRQRAELKITIEGHCDERGTAEFNLALGERRAASVRAYIKKLGVAGKRIKIISYGEEKPLERSATESSWAKNRRAEFKTR